MRILYVVPGMGPCGGIRVIVEHLNRLVDRGHDVFVATPRGAKDRPQWIKLGKDVVLGRPHVYDNANMDIAVATGWKTVPFVFNEMDCPKVWFNQMAEWMFYGPSSPHRGVVKAVYNQWGNLPMINISKWVAVATGHTEFVMGNGVNKGHFYNDGGPRHHAILVEGDNRNYAKDQEAVGWTVARALRDVYDVELWGYAGYHHDHATLFDKFIVKPSHKQMRRLYSGVQFLLKASRYDARACSPVEAMCCGTPTVRAIIKGDDDLVHMDNCLRTEYSIEALSEAATRVLEDQGLLQHLRSCARHYAAKHLNWEDKIDVLEDIFETVVAGSR